MRPMEPCTFCGRAPAVNFALTALNGDPSHTATWQREVLPVLPQGTGKGWHEGAVAESNSGALVAGYTRRAFQASGSD
jgi:hypothetical protein